MANDKKTEVAPVSTPTLSQDVKDAIALASAMVAETLSKQGTAKPAARPRVDDIPRCPDCGQHETACKGKHRQAVVWPNDRHYEKFFQGVRINGVTYISNGANHRITVPAESDVEYMAHMWTENEKEIAQGRVAEHSSNSVHKFVPATKGWR